MPGPGDFWRWPFGIERRHYVLDVYRHGLPNPDPVAATVIDVLDGRHLHAEVLANERDEIGHGTAHLPREDGSELLDLLLAGPVVHEHPDPPVAFRHLLRSVEHQDHAPVAYVGFVDVSGIDVPRQHRVAAVIVCGCCER